MKKKLLFVIIVLEISFFANSQNNTVRQLTVGHVFYDIAQDSNYIWAAANDGIFKYDKYNGLLITHYLCGNTELPSSNITCIALGKDGVKWFGTYDIGLVKYDGSTWTVYNMSNTSMLGNQIVSLAVDKNNILWVLTYGTTTAYSLTRYNGINWTTYHYSLNNFISINAGNSIAIDKNNALWISNYLGAIKYDGNQTTTYYGFDIGINNFFVKSIVVDTNNVKWFSTAESGIVKYNNSTWEVVKPNENNSVIFDQYTLSLDKAKNSIWISSYLPVTYEFSGITEYDGSIFKHYNFQNNLFPFFDIRKVIVDENDNKWIATTMSGVVIYNKNGVYLGVNNNSKESATVYPQPVKDIAIIKFTQAINDESVVNIYSANGIIVKQEKLNKGQSEYIFKRENLISGMYFYYITDVKGVSIKTGKLILE